MNKHKTVTQLVTIPISSEEAYEQLHDEIAGAGASVSAELLAIYGHVPEETVAAIRSGQGNRGRDHGGREHRVIRQPA